MFGLKKKNMSNFHSMEVMGGGNGIQPQVGENSNKIR